jgi:hypothetical protein
MLRHSPVACQCKPTSKLHTEKVRFNSVLPQFSGVSAHKEVSLDSISPQFSGGPQNQENSWPQSSGVSARSNQQTAYKKVRFDSVSPQFSSVSAHKEVSLDSILLQFSGGLQDQARVNNVMPQSSGMSAQSNQQTEYKKVRFNSVLPQFSGMSAHKEVSLDSISLQFRGRLKNQENAWPQFSGMSAQSNQRTAYKKVRFDSDLPQVNGVSAHKEVSLDSILPQISSGLQDQARNQIKHISKRQADQHPNKTQAFPSELISIISSIRGQPIPVRNQNSSLK